MHMVFEWELFVNVTVHFCYPNHGEGLVNTLASSMKDALDRERMEIATMKQIGVAISHATFQDYRFEGIVIAMIQSQSLKL